MGPRAYGVTLRGGAISTSVPPVRPLAWLALVATVAAAPGALAQEPGSLPQLEDTSTASINETATTETGTTETGTTAAPTPAAEDPVDPAWERYHDAFLAIVAGDHPRGRRILQSVVDEFGQHPATDLAAEVLAVLPPEPPKAPPRPAVPPPPTGPKDPFAPEEPSPLARAELATFQTLYGITAGGLMCGAAECSDARVVVGLLALGGGAGLGASLYGTRNGITPGRAQTINAASGWGLFNGLSLALALDFEPQGVFGLMLAGQAVGVVSGVMIGNARDPRGGDVSRATSFGMWAGALTLYTHGVFEFEADGKALWASLLVTSDIALAIGLYLNYANVAPMTRGRVLLIDAGGLVGGLLGMGTVVLAEGEVGNGVAFFSAAILGTLGGLGLATYASRDWDVPDGPNVAIGVLPNEDGGGSVFLGGTF